MKIYSKFVVMSLFSICCFCVKAQSIKIANNLFKNGDFYEAQEIYSDILDKDTNNLKSLIFMGYISLLTNRLEESEKWFNKAKKIKPKLSVINYFLAENYYRQKKFELAAPYYLAIRRKAMAKKMESFSNIEPYKMRIDFDAIRIRFIITDPLPIVEVIINSEYKGYFIIDTGGGELILSDDFAKKTKAEFFGIEKSCGFGGGKKAPLGHGKISTITLGNLIVENVPINTLNLNQLELGGYKIDGIIGTVFLYQFLSTIDYKNGLLILRNKAKYRFNDILVNCSSPKIIPFTMADDHFMMAKGTINNSDTMLFFVDTGLAGNAFTCPKSTIRKTGLIYQKDRRTKSLGGGGHFNSYPMEIENICLGDVCVNKLHGVYGAFPVQIEKSFGFNVNGLISHEFFRNYSLTIDFVEMKYLLSE